MVRVQKKYIGLLGGIFDPNKVSEKTGRKGKNLFLPLRKALTGNSVVPDMGKLLPFLTKIPKI